MKIAIIGAGYVGLVTGVCLAKLGHRVKCIDVNGEKVRRINKGKVPVYERGLGGLLREVLRSNFSATTNLDEAVRDADVIFIAVGTPPKKDGLMELKFVEKAFLSAARIMKRGALLAMKSTVLPGTTEALVRKAGREVLVCMNPEFLAEGRAIDDFMKPDRIVVGANDARAFSVMRRVYKKVKCPVVEVDIKTAEMIKYASNAFLATKVSFMNEIGNICKILGIDVYKVLEGMKYDKRIGEKHMNAGAGFGGSCFPKDVSALIAYSKKLGYAPELLMDVMRVNERQPLRMIALAKKHMKLKGARIAVLGLAFKPETDDMREARSILVINKLLREGSRIVVYDPKAIENAKKIFGKRIAYAKNAKDALKEAKACFIMTEWKEFGNSSLYKNVFVIDGRDVIRLKSNYEGICW